MKFVALLLALSTNPLAVYTVYDLKVAGENGITQVDTKSDKPIILPLPPKAKGFVCALLPAFPRGDYVARTVACKNDKIFFASTVLCSNSRRDIDVQRLTFGDGEPAGVIQFSCMSDYLTEAKR